MTSSKTLHESPRLDQLRTAIREILCSTHYTDEKESELIYPGVELFKSISFEELIQFLSELKDTKVTFPKQSFGCLLGYRWEQEGYTPEMILSESETLSKIGFECEPNLPLYLARQNNSVKGS